MKSSSILFYDELKFVLNDIAITIESHLFEARQGKLLIIMESLGMREF